MEVEILVNQFPTVILMLWYEGLLRESYQPHQNINNGVGHPV